MERLNFQRLKEMQGYLDETIVQKHQLQNVDLINKKVVALEVELSEFANEMRFFKFWSKKGPDYEKALEEFVDSLHFFISLANDLGIEEPAMPHGASEGKESIETVYTKCKQWVLDITKATDREKQDAWHGAYGYFQQMASMCGFSEKDIAEGYVNKMGTNYRRQEQNY